jgi:hypothetical protein
VTNRFEGTKDSESSLGFTIRHVHDYYLSEDWAVMSKKPNPIDKAGLIAHKKVSLLSLNFEGSLLHSLEIILGMLSVIGFFRLPECTGGQHNLACQPIIKCFKPSYYGRMHRKIYANMQRDQHTQRCKHHRDTKYQKQD